MIKVLEISCRSTRMGALTTVRINKKIRGEAFVKRFNVSRSGHHWTEALYISDDFTGVVHIIDITNSGKHHCRALVFENGREVAHYVADGARECPVCMFEER